MNTNKLIEQYLEELEYSLIRIAIGGFKNLSENKVRAKIWLEEVIQSRDEWWREKIGNAPAHREICHNGKLGKMTGKDFSIRYMIDRDKLLDN